NSVRRRRRCPSRHLRPRRRRSRRRIPRLADLPEDPRVTNQVTDRQEGTRPSRPRHRQAGTVRPVATRRSHRRGHRRGREMGCRPPAARRHISRSTLLIRACAPRLVRGAWRWIRETRPEEPMRPLDAHTVEQQLRDAIHAGDENEIMRLGMLLDELAPPKRPPSLAAAALWYAEQG